ncbi:uncharacterized protein TNCV_1605461 [Trichonephila clavipes]|nr:uncharacterized protein TNCV_1605461 [Trichonephila clavipes]
MKVSELSKWNYDDVFEEEIDITFDIVPWENDARSSGEESYLTMLCMGCCTRVSLVKIKWRRSNLELYQLYKESDTVDFIKLQRIKWAGHVVRMNENRTTKVFNAQPIGTRRESRPNLRWIDGLEKYLLVLRTKNWRTLARRLA